MYKLIYLGAAQCTGRLFKFLNACVAISINSWQSCDIEHTACGRLLICYRAWAI